MWDDPTSPRATPSDDATSPEGGLAPTPLDQVADWGAAMGAAALREAAAKHLHNPRRLAFRELLERVRSDALSGVSSEPTPLPELADRGAALGMQALLAADAKAAQDPQRRKFRELLFQVRRQQFRIVK